MKYLFGPVNSRRLGISLGIDLMPKKICSLDCVYCECGATRNFTASVEDYSQAAEVIAELDEYFSGNPHLDAITFSGKGEPTLCKSIGDIIGHIKDKYPAYKIVVLTNGTLLWMPEVRNRIKRADVVMPSLDAVSDEVFNRICRPAQGITSEKLISGIKEFRREYSGRLVLEIFIVPGLNDNPEELALIKKACEDIKPEMIQLNSLDRPSSEKWIKKADMVDMLNIKDFFHPLPVEIIGKPAGRQDNLAGENMREMVLDTIKRRPSTMDDLAIALGANIEKLRLILDELINNGQVVTESKERGLFFKYSNNY